MIISEDLRGFRRDHYLSRSWTLLTGEQGWFKHVLLIALISLIPIVGPLVLMGNAAEAARLTAWGANEAPEKTGTTKNGIGFGKCLSSGWRVFLVGLVWGLCIYLISLVLGVIPAVGGILAFVWGIFSIYLSTLGMVGEVRATIYQKVVGGLRLPTIWEMGKRDFGGLMRIIGMEIALGLIFGCIVGLIVVVGVLGMLPQIIAITQQFSGIYGSYVTDSTLVYYLLAQIISGLGFTIVIVVIVAALLSAFTQLLLFNAIGLWMRQFNVPAWGPEDAPVPAAPTTPGQLPGGYIAPAPDAASQNAYTQTSQTAAAPNAYAPTAAPNAYAPASQPTAAPNAYAPVTPVPAPASTQAPTQIPAQAPTQPQAAPAAPTQVTPATPTTATPAAPSAPTPATPAAPSAPSAASDASQPIEPIKLDPIAPPEPVDPSATGDSPAGTPTDQQ